MRTDLYRDPKIIFMAETLMDQDGPLARYVCRYTERDCNVTRNVMRNATVGALVSVWGVLRHQGNREGSDLRVRGVTASVVDDIADMEGFGRAMMACGWLIEDTQGLLLPRFFEEHNTDPDESYRAKNRERQRRYRNAIRNVTGNVTGNVTVAPHVTHRDRDRDREERENSINSPSPASTSAQLEPENPPLEEPPEDGGEEIPGWKDVPSRMRCLAIPPELSTPEFVSAWHSWGRYQSQRGGGPWRISQDQLIQQLRLLNPFGPFVAALTLYRTIANGWQQLEPDKTEAAWREWLAETLSRICVSDLANHKTLDRWWRHNAPLLLRTETGRLLALAVAFQAGIDINGPSKGVPLINRFREILAASDPWAEISQPAREKATTTLAELTGGLA